jgi:hypothetical protein
MGSRRTRQFERRISKRRRRAKRQGRRNIWRTRRKRRQIRKGKLKFEEDVEE